MSAESDLRDRVVAASLDLAVDGITGPQLALDVDTMQRVRVFYEAVIELADYVSEAGMFSRIVRVFPGAQVVDA